MNLPPILYLMLAIVFEVIATVTLRFTEGFTKPLPIVVVLVGYTVSFYFLSLTLQTIPLGFSYAVWSGIGTAAVVVIGVLLFREEINWLMIVGIILIIAGVAVLNFAAPEGTTG